MGLWEHIGRGVNYRWWNSGSVTVRATEVERFLAEMRGVGVEVQA